MKSQTTICVDSEVLAELRRQGQSVSGICNTALRASAFGTDDKEFKATLEAKVTLEKDIRLLRRIRTLYLKMQNNLWSEKYHTALKIFCNTHDCNMEQAVKYAESAGSTAKESTPATPKEEV